MTQEDLAARLNISAKSVSRHESGERVPRMPTVRKLAKLYGVPVSVINDALADNLNGHSVGNLGLLVSLEQGASEIRWWEPVSLCGLLQTEDYATAVESAGPTPASSDEIARRVALRMRRKQVLDKLRLSAIIDRSVLVRDTGGPEVMADQLAHLRALCERPNIAVRVAPFDQRAHAAGTGPFTIIAGDTPDAPYTVVTHHLLGPQLWEMRPFVEAYETLFAHLWSVSDDLAKVEL